MSDRKPTKTGICTMELKTPINSISAKLDRCERICEHYSYCQYVTDMNDQLIEMEQMQ